MRDRQNPTSELREHSELTGRNLPVSHLFTTTDQIADSCAHGMGMHAQKWNTCACHNYKDPCLIESIKF